MGGKSDNTINTYKGNIHGSQLDSDNSTKVSSEKYSKFACLHKD